MSCTEQLHFMQCINENCKVFHLVRASQLDNPDLMLCERCRGKRKKEHVVQCLNCKVILDFIPLLANESPNILYVEKCSLCGGTLEDEVKIIGSPINELYF